MNDLNIAMNFYSNTFLHHVAKYFFEKNGEDFEKVWLVFPNNRAGVFFRKYLASFYDKPVFSPNIITISEFYQSLTDLRSLDKLSLIFELFDEYVKHTGKNEKFDEFYFWGEMILNDFNDIDKSGVDAKDIFRNIVDLKEIDDNFSYMTDEQIEHIRHFWGGFKETEVSEFRDEFKRVWKDLYPLYIKFKQRLLDKESGYDGMIISRIVNELKLSNSNLARFDKVYFIGHNALQTNEKELLEILKRRGQILFFWDFDKYYTDNAFHEAGRIIKGNIAQFPAPQDFPLNSKPNDSDDFYTNIRSRNRTINIYPVNSNTGQTKVISSILDGLSEDNINLPEQNAVILPDEKLLVPLLNSIPSKYKNVNITMGYPAVGSVTYSLLEDLIELQIGKRKKGNNVSFFYKPVVGILNHQLVSLVSGKDNSIILDEIIKKNKIRIDDKYLTEISDVNKLIFVDVDSGKQMPAYLKDVLSGLSRLLNGIEEKNNLPVLELEVIYHLYLNLNRLDELFSKYNIDFDVKTFYRFFRQSAWGTNITFSGEPLKGLQIMGILETRVLDFNTIIIPSMNEGVFPASGKTNSFIPYSLRKGFGLPLIDFQDSIFAYYFYRLLHRSENIHLLYNTQSANSNSEMSRYLFQLTYDPDIKLNTVVYPDIIKIDHYKSKSIIKDEKIIDKLLKYTDIKGEIEQWLSPSALTTYLTCPLRFYYRYICKIKAPVSIDEEVNPMLFGNILHKTLQFLYEGKEMMVLNEVDIENIIKDKTLVDDAIKKAFAIEYFKEKNINTVEISGRNILVFEVIKKNVLQILRNDKRMVPFSIIQMEKANPKLFGLRFNDRILNVGLKGYIDRVEQKDGIVTVIDYKTGGDSRTVKTFEDIFDRSQKKKTKAIFQVFLYAWLLENEKVTDKDLGVGIILSRELFSNEFSRDIKVNYKSVSYADYSEEFKLGLSELIYELFDKDIPFIATDNSKHCEYCDFLYLCNKQ